MLQLSSGAFKNVLTNSEKNYLEYIMGLEPNALSVYKKVDNFWSTATEGTINKVMLKKGDNRLDLSNPEDYIRYKILLANNDIGLYNFRKELIERLIEKGNQIYISLPYGKKVDLLTEKGCRFIDTKIDRRGTNPLKDFKLLIKYNKIIKDINPDVVLTYTIKPNIYGGIICRKLKKKCIANVTGLGSSKDSNKILTKLINCMYK